MTKIRLTNSAARTKQDFVPLDPARVRMYVCGPTVYDRAHMGNARSACVFDTLFRLLRHVYGDDHVVYIRNITDVDDKINARAAETGRAISDITAETTAWYVEDMAALGCLDPTESPRATGHIAAMIAMIEDLVARGHAYAAEGHVLFSVGSYGEYGRLSGRSVEDMIAGARVEVAPYKRDPMDFVLWKPAEEGSPAWDSPWGPGRPGWHIECSAMAGALLGETFDIHGGGGDLMFPHHENEIAQSACAHGGAAMARYWLHNEMLQVEGRKMSKSLGNFFTVRDRLDEGVPGEVIRHVLMTAHYRKPMDWTEEKVRAATAALRHWRDLTRGARPAAPDPDLVAALADDLNTAEALAVLHRLGTAVAAGEADPGTLLASARMLGLLEEGLGDWARPVDLSHLEARLSHLRARAKETKDFTAVDALKADLAAAGVEVRMHRDGVELAPGADFDPVRLPQIG